MPSFQFYLGSLCGHGSNSLDPGHPLGPCVMTTLDGVRGGLSRQHIRRRWIHSIYRSIISASAEELLAISIVLGMDAVRIPEMRALIIGGTDETIGKAADLLKLPESAKLWAQMHDFDWPDLPA